jgi:hypothetical protein
VKPKDLLEETWLKLRRNLEWFKSCSLDQTGSLSWPENNNKRNITTGHCGLPDRTRRWRGLQPGELGSLTGRWAYLTGHHCGRVQSSTERIQRGKSVTECVQSVQIRLWGTSYKTQKFELEIAVSHWPDASGHNDRRVRSIRKMLSWHITVGFMWGVYKYFSHSSIWGLLLICSAEKHLSSARECKSLVRRLWFENLRLRTSLVHRE